ncbi:hypothetical protein EYF80_031792 [Liparis tanakae]|uniref:Uncharacterized protein n=1 Tax=Liparis tanakae TaxID=230148 RepID=A0A4Z2GWL1_9TELE|nr:hypothetical protein EYF80_031792 [Liparis tanakae]
MKQWLMGMGRACIAAAAAAKGYLHKEPLRGTRANQIRTATEGGGGGGVCRSMWPPRDLLIVCAFPGLLGSLSSRIILFKKSVNSSGLISKSPVPRESLVSERLISAARRQSRGDESSQKGGLRWSLGVSGLERRSGAEGGAQAPPVAPPAPTQHKVVVGGGAHGVEHVGFVGELKICGRRREYRRSLDHLPRVVLTGQLTGSRQIRQNTTTTSPNINTGSPARGEPPDEHDSGLRTKEEELRSGWEELHEELERLGEEEEEEPEEEKSSATSWREPEKD